MMKRTTQLAPGDRVMVINEPGVQPAVIDSVDYQRAEDLIGLSVEEAYQHAGWCVAFTSGLALDPVTFPGLNANTEWAIAE